MTTYIAALVLLSAAAAYMFGFFWRIGDRSKSASERFREEGAASVLEFTLVFPIFLMIILIIWQLLLLINATQVVSYAAFSAARSAIVVIPMSLGNEGQNQFLGGDSSQKQATIKEAASIACTPISPPITEWAKESGIFGAATAIGGVTGEVGDAALLAILVNQAGLNGTRALQKAIYASQFTDVTVTGPTRNGAFTENAPITVTVNYKFYLNVPYANRIFSDGVFAAFRGGHQKTLTARYTLPNEGGKEAL